MHVAWVTCTSMFITVLMGKTSYNLNDCHQAISKYMRYIHPLRDHVAAKINTQV